MVIYGSHGKDSKPNKTNRLEVLRAVKVAKKGTNKKGGYQREKSRHQTDENERDDTRKVMGKGVSRDWGFSRRLSQGMLTH